MFAQNTAQEVPGRKRWLATFGPIPWLELVAPAVIIALVASVSPDAFVVLGQLAASIIAIVLQTSLVNQAAERTSVFVLGIATVYPLVVLGIMFIELLQQTSGKSRS